jgi:molybdopterin converting factor small subunit
MFHAILLRFNKYRELTKHEAIEKVKDKYFEQHYTNCARMHLNKVLYVYNRETQETYDESLNYIKELGLFTPYADSIKYLKTMRYISGSK